MDSSRKMFEKFYQVIKPIVFSATKKDPEIAHWLFKTACSTMNSLSIDKFVLDNSTNHKTKIPISPAAGFNENGDIPIDTMYYLGFDRNVIGTVTNLPYQGNKRKPRSWRHTKIKGLENNLGLPNKGSSNIRKKILSQNNSYHLPIEINVAPTPDKNTKSQKLKDIKGTFDNFYDIPYVDRFTLNISCPNTSVGRDQYQNMLHYMLDISDKYPQNILVKVSPDIEEKTADEIVETCNKHKVYGYITTNTTKQPLQKDYRQYYLGKGGGSGNFLYNKSVEVQDMFEQRKKEGQIIVGVGGINTKQRKEERINKGASEIRLYTPILFKGPEIIRKLDESP